VAASSGKTVARKSRPALETHRNHVIERVVIARTGHPDTSKERLTGPQEKTWPQRRRPALQG
jgi:hypothetical protein